MLGMDPTGMSILLAFLSAIEFVVICLLVAFALRLERR